MVFLSPTDNKAKATQREVALFMDRIPSSKTIKALPNQLKQTKYYISFLISSVWLLMSANQLDLETGIVNRRRKIA